MFPFKKKIPRRTFNFSNLESQKFNWAPGSCWPNPASSPVILAAWELSLSSEHLPLGKIWSLGGSSRWHLASLGCPRKGGATLKAHPEWPRASKCALRLTASGDMEANCHLELLF